MARDKYHQQLIDTLKEKMVRPLLMVLIFYGLGGEEALLMLAQKNC